MLSPANVVCHADAASRKRVLQLISELLADESLADDAIFEGLMARERLGSTGLGDGIAIPHCRLPIERMKVALLTLEQAIDYEAGDGQPVDLVFVLVVPEDETQAHLDALAALSQIFTVQENTDELRRATTVSELQNCMQRLLKADTPGSLTG